MFVDCLIMSERLLLPSLAEAPLSDGELGFLWSFIDGSIMFPATRWRLRDAWGMCPRHALGWLQVELLLRPNLLHGPALLYEDLLSRAVRAMDVHGPGRALRLAWRLRMRAPCLMCELGYSHQSPGFPPEGLAQRRADLVPLCSFVHETSPWWEEFVCGTCVGNAHSARCREHLRAEHAYAEATFREQQERVRRIAGHVSAFARSFRWEFRGTATDADRAGLIAAIGWCQGWGSFVELVREDV